MGHYELNLVLGQEDIIAYLGNASSIAQVKSMVKKLGYPNPEHIHAEFLQRIAKEGHGFRVILPNSNVAGQQVEVEMKWIAS